MNILVAFVAALDLMTEKFKEILKKQCNHGDKQNKGDTNQFWLLKQQKRQFNVLSGQKIRLGVSHLALGGG